MPEKSTLRIHLLVEDSEGPIRSGGMALNTPLGKVQVGAPGGWKIVCDASLFLNDLNRGTGEPWAVRCADCFATEEFKKINRPKPGSREARAGGDQVAAEDMTPPPCGCH